MADSDDQPVSRRWLWAGVVALLAALAVTCKPPEVPWKPGTAHPASFQAWVHAHLRDGQLVTHERIHLRRSSSYDFTSFELVLERGGRATRSGGYSHWPSNRTREQVGEIWEGPFLELCWLLDTVDLPSRSTEWPMLSFHAIRIEVEWVTSGSKRVLHAGYLESAPPALIGLAAAIERVARDIEWVPAPAPGDDLQDGSHR